MASPNNTIPSEVLEQLTMLLLNAGSGNPQERIQQALAAIAGLNGEWQEGSQQALLAANEWAGYRQEGLQQALAAPNQWNGEQQETYQSNEYGEEPTQPDDNLEESAQGNEPKENGSNNVEIDSNKCGDDANTQNIIVSAALQQMTRISINRNIASGSSVSRNIICGPESVEKIDLSNLSPSATRKRRQ